MVKPIKKSSKKTTKKTYSKRTQNNKFSDYPIPKSKQYSTQGKLSIKLRERDFKLTNAKHKPPRFGVNPSAAIRYSKRNGHGYRCYKKTDKIPLHRRVKRKASPYAKYMGAQWKKVKPGHWDGKRTTSPVTLNNNVKIAKGANFGGVVKAIAKSWKGKGNTHKKVNYKISK